MPSTKPPMPTPSSVTDASIGPLFLCPFIVPPPGLEPRAATRQGQDLAQENPPREAAQGPESFHILRLDTYHSPGPVSLVKSGFRELNLDPAFTKAAL